MNVSVTNQPRVAPSGAQHPLLNVVIVGHVDHGKSTLIGRLLHESGGLPDGKLDALKAISARRGMPFEWSFLLDALQTERDQGITIDTSQVRFRRPSRDIVLIDAPGHVEFLRNMITGAAQASAALLLVDATEGVREQTRRHGYLLQLLGIPQVAVVINKMDRIGFDAARFEDISTEITAFLSGLGLIPSAVIPISARQGDGVARHTSATEWYKGPTVLEALDGFTPTARAVDRALRLPVQAVYKFDDRRIIAGRLESGRIAVGDEIVIMPGGQRARVKSIESWPLRDEARSPRIAVAGRSVGITLDRDLFVVRGDVISPATEPVMAGRRIRARVFWLHQNPLEVGTRIGLRIGTAEAIGSVTAIEKAIDPGRLESADARTIAQNHVGEIELRLPRSLAADPHAVSPDSGQLVFELDGRIAGGGRILSIDNESLPTARATPGSDHEARSPALAAEMTATLARLAPLLAELPPRERIARLRRELPGRLVFTTSFGLEDQLILHFMSELSVDIDVVTLDTGRLFPETYNLWAETERRYGRRIRAIYPRREGLETLVEQHGINGFYESREARLACCHVRKVEPLGRALAGATGWITGLRADQSTDRRNVGVLSLDADRHLLKLNPLFDCTRAAILALASANEVPINPLHEKGFASIGCAPCTRALAPGEPERAGRWWWEQDAKKECGLHTRGR